MTIHDAATKVVVLWEWQKRTGGRPIITRQLDEALYALKVEVEKENERRAVEDAYNTKLEDGQK